jgi:hypothetical protein
MHDVSSSSSWSCTSSTGSSDGSTGSSDGAELVNARDHEAHTAEITDCDPLDATTLHKARLIVACHSATPEEAAETMHMLGIHPDQTDEESYATRVANLPNTAGSLVVHRLSWEFGKSTRMLDDPKGGRV